MRVCPPLSSLLLFLLCRQDKLTFRWSRQTHQSLLFICQVEGPKSKNFLFLAGTVPILLFHTACVKWWYIPFSSLLLIVLLHYYCAFPFLCLCWCCRVLVWRHFLIKIYFFYHLSSNHIFIYSKIQKDYYITVKYFVTQLSQTLGRKYNIIRNNN